MKIEHMLYVNNLADWLSEIVQFLNYLLFSVLSKLFYSEYSYFIEHFLPSIRIGRFPLLSIFSLFSSHRIEVSSRIDSSNILNFLLYLKFVSFSYILNLFWFSAFILLIFPKHLGIPFAFYVQEFLVLSCLWMLCLLFFQSSYEFTLKKKKTSLLFCDTKNIIIGYIF